MHLIDDPMISQCNSCDSVEGDGVAVYGGEKSLKKLRYMSGSVALQYIYLVRLVYRISLASLR